MGASSRGRELGRHGLGGDPDVADTGALIGAPAAKGWSNGNAGVYGHSVEADDCIRNLVAYVSQPLREDIDLAFPARSHT